MENLQSEFNPSVSIEQIRPELTWRLRQQVLYPDEPWYTMGLDEDEQGYHFAAFSNSQIIAVVSLFQQGSAYQFRKFAVAPAHQHQGIGTAMLEVITRFARLGGGTRLWCKARLTAIEFYQKKGFITEGEEFIKNKIQYIVMATALSAPEGNV